MLSLLFLILVGANGENSISNVCESSWIDAADVGMGCLLFDSTTTALPWLDAVRHCQDKDAILVEIFTEHQLDFVRMELDMLDDHEFSKNW